MRAGQIQPEDGPLWGAEYGVVFDDFAQEDFSRQWRDGVIHLDPVGDHQCVGVAGPVPEHLEGSLSCWRTATFLRLPTAALPEAELLCDTHAMSYGRWCQASRRRRAGRNSARASDIRAATGRHCDCD